MNRKIKLKFRGRHKVSGDWYYGYLYKRDNDYIITTDGYTEYVVDKKTIGQCTGLKDKNGKWIYEGDILRNDWNYNRFVVEWGEGEYPHHSGADSVNNKFNCKYGGCEILGNIYDNPELLK